MRELNNNYLSNIKHLKQCWPNTRKLVMPLEYNDYSPTPSGTNIRRVTGIDGIAPESFFNAGYSDLTTVMNIAEVYGFVGGRVLDWGVGCARLFRHLNPSLRTDAVGVDIDPINIDWCASNLLHGRFDTVKPYGAFDNTEDSSVDLLYSFSVMTHLGESDQAHWLVEINRVLRGLAVISVHGLYHTAVCTDWASIPDDMSEWLSYGFRDSQANNVDIQDIAPDLYYKDVAQTPKYIRDVWSKYIDVVDIIPGGFGMLHDAVVCKPLPRTV